jgi:lambda family phage tail tape measure protein
MASPATQFTINALVKGLAQVEGLKSAVRSLQNTAQPAAEHISELRDAAKSLGNAAEASTSDLRTSVTVLKSLKDQVALTSKEYRDLSNDLKTVENRFNAANTAAKQFSASAGPLSGGTAGAGIMGRPTEKLDPYMRLGFGTNDPEYWRKRQETHPGGAAIFPQQLDYAATNKALTGLESALDQMNNITNRGRQERLQLNAKYNQLENEQQDAALRQLLQDQKRYDDIALEDFDRRLERNIAKKSKGRQRLATTGQTVGAIAAAGVFGGPEGAIGATIGAFGGPQGALIGGAIGAQVGMLRQSAAGVAEYATQLTLAKITLAQASTGIQQYNQQLQIARNVSKDYSVGLLETINGYAQVAIAAKANGLSVAQTENIYRGVIATGAAFGKSQEDLSAIVRATTQILSKAKVTAEELGGQLGERIPGAVAKFAEKTGRSLPELAKDLEQGKVTIADFVAFTKGQLDDYDKIARIIGESPEKAGARLEIALDTAAENYGGFFQTVGAQFQDFATRLVTWVNQNSQTIKRFVTFSVNNFSGLMAGIDFLITKIEEIPKAFEKYLPKVLKAQFDFSVFGEDTTPAKFINERLKTYTDNWSKIFPDFVPTDAMFGKGANAGLGSNLDPVAENKKAEQERREADALKATIPIIKQYGEQRLSLLNEIKARQEKINELQAEQTDLNKLQVNDSVRRQKITIEDLQKELRILEIRKNLSIEEINIKKSGDGPEKQKLQLALANLKAVNKLKESNVALNNERKKANNEEAKEIIARAELIKKTQKEIQELSKPQKEELEEMQLRMRYRRDPRALEAKLEDLNTRRRFASRKEQIPEGDTTGQLEQINKVEEEAIKGAEAIRALKRSIDELNAADVGQGFKNGVESFLTGIGTMSENVSQLTQNAFQGLSDGIAELVTTGKMNFNDFANSIIKDMIRIATQQLILRPILQGIGGLFGGGGGTLAPTDMFKYVNNAKGNLYAQNGIQAFARGGIVDKPMLFPFAKGIGLMGEAGPEAIMPLRRGRDGNLGVAGGGGTTNVVVNVDAGGTKAQGDAPRGDQLGKALSAAVQAELIKQRRPGGLLA